jgi:hypothetical protein
MGLLDPIRVARQTHDALRSSLPSRTNLAEKADLYRTVKSVLDDLWKATDRPGTATSATEVRRAVRRLTVDAEYHAGLNNSEGFRDAAEASGQYDLLERAFVDAR